MVAAQVANLQWHACAMRVPTKSLSPVERLFLSHMLGGVATPPRDMFRVRHGTVRSTTG